MKRQAGFSLIEVTVAMAVMSIGLSGLCALLFQTVLGMSSLKQTATADLLARRLRAELALAVSEIDTLASAPGPAACTAGAPCSPPEFSRLNYRRWQSLVEENLPLGRGLVCRDATPSDGTPGHESCDGAGPAVIKIFWRGKGPGSGNWLRHVLEIGR